MTALPQRPNLDHLRGQAKALLADFRAGEPGALATIKHHLPAARDLPETQIKTLPLRLADAQFAIARSTGFASWPQLGRHVHTLRSLEGHWGFTSLVAEGMPIPPEGLAHSRILIDGDRFRTESPDAIYEGIFHIDVEKQPMEININFVEGPEAGNTNRGIFRLDGDTLEICLDMQGRERPLAFAAPEGSGHALEMLHRESSERPVGVQGGSPPDPLTKWVDPATHEGEFAFVPSRLLTLLEGEWDAVKLVNDGKALPETMLAGAKRIAAKNSLKVLVGGQVMVDALIRVDESRDPVGIDYLNQGCGRKGIIQLGILKWEDDVLSVAMALPGQPRPTRWESTPGSGITLSVWKRR